MTTWSARDWRQFCALLILALGNIPLTACLAYALWGVHIDKGNWLIFWLGLSISLLIGLNFIGLSAILGRRTFKLKAGDNEIEATGEGAERAMQHVEDNSE